MKEGTFTRDANCLALHVCNFNHLQAFDSPSSLLTTSWLNMPGEQTGLCKVHVSTSGAASPGSRSGNPAAADSADTAASATGGDIFACRAQNQGPNPTYTGGSRWKAFARRTITKS